MKPTHEELQRQVTDLLAATGWSHLHVRRTIGRGSKWTTSTNIKGWPDLAPCWTPRQPGRLLAIEIKVPPDNVRPEQDKVLTDLASSGFECWVVWPEDIDLLASRLRPGMGRSGHITNSHERQP